MLCTCLWHWMSLLLKYAAEEHCWSWLSVHNLDQLIVETSWGDKTWSDFYLNRAAHPKLGSAYCYNMLRSGKQSQLIVGTGCQLTTWVNHCWKKLLNHNLNLRTFLGRQLCCSLSLVGTCCQNFSMDATRYPRTQKTAKARFPRSL